MTETSTKGGLFHRIKSQKQYKKITDSEEYKKADYHTKNKLLKEGGSELPKRFGTTYKKDAVKPKAVESKAKGGRANFKHGKWVRTPNPHVDVDVYVDKKGKEDDKPGSRVKVLGSEMKFKKPEKSREKSRGRPGRKKLQHGGSSQSHYLQHGYGPTKAKLRTGKPKIAKKGWA